MKPKTPTPPSLLVLLLERRRDASLAFYQWDRMIADLLADPALADAARQGARLMPGLARPPAPPRMISGAADLAPRPKRHAPRTRKAMTAAARSAISKRMKAYWATQRAQGRRKKTA